MVLEVLVLMQYYIIIVVGCPLRNSSIHIPVFTGTGC